MKADLPAFLLSEASLRHSGSTKWLKFPADVLPLWVADMDYAVAPAITAALQERLFEEDGTVRKFINIYVKGEDIRFGAGLATELKDGDDVSIVPAASGG